MKKIFPLSTILRWRVLKIREGIKIFVKQIYKRTVTTNKAVICVS